jgi:hypothetical protein
VAVGTTVAPADAAAGTAVALVGSAAAYGVGARFSKKVASVCTGCFFGGPSLVAASSSRVAASSSCAAAVDCVEEAIDCEPTSAGLSGVSNSFTECVPS